MIGHGIFKSSLQIAIERNSAVEKFMIECQKLTQSYTVENSVFSFNGKNLDEVTSGFMVQHLQPTSNIVEFRDELLNMKSPVIRIQENANGEILFECGEYFEDASSIEGATSIYNIGKRAFLLNKK